MKTRNKMALFLIAISTISLVGFGVQDASAHKTVNVNQGTQWETLSPEQLDTIASIPFKIHGTDTLNNHIFGSFGGLDRVWNNSPYQGIHQAMNYPIFNSHGQIEATGTGQCSDYVENGGTPSGNCMYTLANGRVIEIGTFFAFMGKMAGSPNYWASSVDNHFMSTMLCTPEQQFRNMYGDIPETDPTYEEYQVFKEATIAYFDVLYENKVTQAQKDKAWNHIDNKYVLEIESNTTKKLHDNCRPFP